ncbi:hypothetical protein F4604DRAFT_1914027 [Suillus subluteus]|nr:hypothetical protein F4604DRAFT_1914027 [Suillus subluteus]
MGETSNFAVIGSRSFMRDSMGLDFFGLRRWFWRRFPLVILGIVSLETFQLGVQAIKVLHPSDEPMEECFVPILSTTSVDMSKDDSAIAGFSTFDVAISPAKQKNKHANGQRHRGRKGKDGLTASSVSRLAW